MVALHQETGLPFGDRKAVADFIPQLKERCQGRVRLPRTPSSTASAKRAEVRAQRMAVDLRRSLNETQIVAEAGSPLGFLDA